MNTRNGGRREPTALTQIATIAAGPMMPIVALPMAPPTGTGQGAGRGGSGPGRGVALAAPLVVMPIPGAGGLPLPPILGAPVATAMGGLGPFVIAMVAPEVQAVEDAFYAGHSVEDLMPLGSDSLEVKRAKGRQLQQRHAEKGAEEIEAANIMAACKKWSGDLQEPEGPGSQKRKHHFPSQDGKIYVLYEDNTAGAKKLKGSNVMRRMADPRRSPQLLNEGIVLDVKECLATIGDRVRDKNFSPPFESLSKWNSIQELPIVSTADNLAHLLQLDSQLDIANGFNLGMFLPYGVEIDSLSNLKRAVENVVRVFMCFYDGQWKDAAIVTDVMDEDFLATLDIKFVRHGCEHRFNRFCRVINKQSVANGDAILDTPSLCIAKFIEIMEITEEMFSVESGSGRSKQSRCERRSSCLRTKDQPAHSRTESPQQVRRTQMLKTEKRGKRVWSGRERAAPPRRCTACFG